MTLPIVALTTLIWCVQSYNILLPVADMTSHVIYFSRLAENLRSRGHEVTLLLPSKLMVPENIQRMEFNTITYHTPGQSLMLTDDFKTFAHEMAFNPSFSSMLKMKDLNFQVIKDMGMQLFKDKQALQSVEDGNYDFVIVDFSLLPYYFIPYKLGKPYASVAMACMDPISRVPIMPSYVPHLLTSYTDNMSFMQRTINFLFYSGVAFYDFGGYEDSRMFVPEKPEVGYNALLLNASLCLQLRDKVIDFVRPEMPGVIPIANLMARKAKPLPTELQSYMDQSSNGVILVSFGTMVAELPPEVIHKMIMAFKTIDWNVIFRYPRPADLGNVPPNVRVMSWVPQNDILSHSNLKLFVTHCGLNSLIETFYHGVPVIGFPRIVDQFGNAAIAKSKGIGEVLAIKDFTSEELQKSIKAVIGDKKYSTAAQKLSTIYKDILAHAPSDPVYWIEHVIKYGDRHLRSHATKMPMYQYLMIDVIAFLALSGFVLLAILYTIGRFVIIMICCRKGKAKSEWFFLTYVNDT